MRGPSGRVLALVRLTIHLGIRRDLTRRPSPAAERAHGDVAALAALYAGHVAVVAHAHRLGVRIARHLHGLVLPSGTRGQQSRPAPWKWPSAAALAAPRARRRPNQTWLRGDVSDL